MKGNERLKIVFETLDDAFTREGIRSFFSIEKSDRENSVLIVIDDSNYKPVKLKNGSVFSDPSDLSDSAVAKLFLEGISVKPDLSDYMSFRTKSFLERHGKRDLGSSSSAPTAKKAKTEGGELTTDSIVNNPSKVLKILEQVEDNLQKDQPIRGSLRTQLLRDLNNIKGEDREIS